LLLLPWIVWGEGVMGKVLGDFSFAIWDASHQTLSCARDFCGARPFFYSWREGVFCYSNTLNALRLALEVSDSLDETYGREFLLTGLYSDPARTVWRISGGFPQVTG
jgi:asparagine synthase (glutamine-hydrolysing)